MLNKNYHVPQKTTSNGVNQEKPSLKGEADKLMKIKGNVRGTPLETHAAYIHYRKGEKGVQAVEEKLKELGYPLRFKEIMPLEWRPEALSVLIMLVVKEVFDWTDSDIFDMGGASPQYSFIVKVFAKYFLSAQKILEESPKLWHTHFDFGSAETEFNEKEKYALFREKGYKFHPTSCFYHAGYYLRVAQLVIKSKKIIIEETKCVHRGDPYHEYTIRWV